MNAAKPAALWPAASLISPLGVDAPPRINARREVMRAADPED